MQTDNIHHLRTCRIFLKYFYVTYVIINTRLWKFFMIYCRMLTCCLVFVHETAREIIVHILRPRVLEEL